MAAPGPVLINVTQDGLVRKKINVAGSSNLERPYDGDYCVVRYSLKTLKAPVQVIDSSQRPGTSKETAVVQIGAGALVQCIETVIKGMYPGEEASVFIDARAMHELRDMLMDNLVLEIELKTILDGPPNEFEGAMVYPLGYSATMDTANTKKLQGNQALGAQDSLGAIEFYQQGLQLLSTLENLPPHELVEMRRLQVVLHLNLSASYTATLATNLAINHAQNALDIVDNGAPVPEVTANRCKAYFRLGQAYEKATQFQASLWNYIRAAQVKNDTAIHACVARVKPLAEKEKALAAATNPIL